MNKIFATICILVLAALACNLSTPSEPAPTTMPLVAQPAFTPLPSPTPNIVEPTPTAFEPVEMYPYYHMSGTIDWTSAINEGVESKSETATTNIEFESGAAPAGFTYNEPIVVDIRVDGVNICSTQTFQTLDCTHTNPIGIGKIELFVNDVLVQAWTEFGKHTIDQWILIPMPISLIPK